MSIAHDIVGDVHGGAAGLVDEGTLVQPSEYLGGGDIIILLDNEICPT